MSSLNSSSYSLQAPVLAVLQQQSHKIQIDPTHTSFASNNSSRLFNSQYIQLQKVSSIINVPLPGIRPPSGAMGPKNYLFTGVILEEILKTDFFLLWLIRHRTHLTKIVSP
ncbi:hypothetical protein AVEN_192998-1 [Araneus ventricosus]|uniref:Uncharacterized protein n=1 Tax=Araneus ventricosus TaxID=182803 RepID=A0A4Y2JW24_ARAVE|nr:hypothetical protein AVEN_192998-1 [Araneus ventricosus]